MIVLFEGSVREASSPCAWLLEALDRTSVGSELWRSSSPENETTPVYFLGRHKSSLLDGGVLHKQGSVCLDSLRTAWG